MRLATRYSRTAAASNSYAGEVEPRAFARAVSSQEDSTETKLRYRRVTIANFANKPGTMDCEFIQAIETWGSGGEMMDLVVLKDGRVLVIAEYGIAFYKSREAFESGDISTAVER